MQNLNYTPINVEKLKGIKPNNVNFYLLVIVTIAAAIFSVLLFVYIQQKNEKLNQLSNTEAISEVTPSPTIEPTIITPTKVVLQKIATDTGKIGTPTPSIRITPPAGLKTSTNEANTSSASAY